MMLSKYITSKKFRTIILAISLSAVVLCSVVSNAENIDKTNNINNNQTAVSTKDWKDLTPKKLKTMYDAQKYPDIVVQSKIYLKYYPKDSDVRYYLALTFIKLKKPGLAGQQLTLALQSTPDYLGVRLLLIRIKLKQEKYAEVLKLAEEGDKYHKDNTELLYDKAVAYYFLNQLQKSIQTLEVIVKLEPQNEKSQKLLKNLQKVEAELKAKKMAKTQEQKQEEKAKAKKGGIDIDYIKGLIKDKRYVKSKQKSIEYLQHYPGDVDVRYLLAIIYNKLKEYEPAKQQLKLVLQGYPNYEGAWDLLLDLEFKTRSYQAALKLIYAKQQQYPGDAKFLYLEAKVYYMRGYFFKSVIILNRAFRLEPHDENSKKLFIAIKDIDPYFTAGLNEVGIFQNNQDVSSTNDNTIWNYTSIYYGRQTFYGKIIARINYAHRFRRSGYQGELEAYPVINKHLYFHIDLAYGTNPSLFPDERYGLGAFTYFSNIDFGITGRFDKIAQTNLTVASSRLGMTLGSYWIYFRPYYFVPKEGPRSILYTLGIRKYGNYVDEYVELVIGGGRAPDLADLQTVSFFNLKMNFAQFTVHFPIPGTEHHGIMLIAVLAERQVFPNGRVRKFGGINLGFAWRF